MHPLKSLALDDDTSDSAFDAIYPASVVKLSELFWTPVSVAKCAAAFLVDTNGAKILDVGSGVGKFCLVGACTTNGNFHGIEQRHDLVELSTALATSLDTAPTFQCGNAIDHNWSEYQGIYLYNPFFELGAGPWCRIDDTVGFNKGTQREYVETVTAKLAEARQGTRVATYYGFGGSMPKCYRLVAEDRSSKGPLRMWIKE